jgi:hypothetical protein
MRPLIVLVPKGMSAKDVAETFNAYLLGAGALRKLSGDQAPYEKEPGRWVLDGFNDYFMRCQNPHTFAELSCRYESQQAVIEAMAALFNARYNQHHGHKRVHAEKLRELGFPEKVIEEAVRAAERGLFDIEPSPGIVERTVQSCLDKGLIPSAHRDTSLLSKMFKSILGS